MQNCFLFFSTSSCFHLICPLAILVNTFQYILKKDGILPPRVWYISHYTPYGVYRINAIHINEGNMSILIV